MIALLIAAALIQSSPDPASQNPADKPPGLQVGGLPKDDYSLVAWCHGAVAGQLELDPIVKADMEKIEGKAKVAARAASDEEMEKERRAFLKDYERALASAEAASPTYIHETGVHAEERGYAMWTATRNKASIWRMLDWGMWDPNDVGCNDAAKRLFEKSSLFGEALKGSSAPSEPAPPPAPSPAVETPPSVQPAEAVAELKPADPNAVKVGEAPPELKPAAPDAGQAATADGAPAGIATTPPSQAAIPTDPAVAQTPTKKGKKIASKATAKKKLSMASSAEEIRDAVANSKPDAASSKTETPTASTEASATPPALRGPQ